MFPINFYFTIIITIVMTQKNVAQHLELYEYQKKILESIRNENIKRIVVVAGRKIGKSMLASESARWFAKKLLKFHISF